MTIEGSIIKEQGVTFGIVIVKKHAMSTNQQASDLRQSIQASLVEFSDIPLILACQDERGVFSYQGRPDLVKFLANLQVSQIPWRRYTY
jgi:hypothetical protein